MLLKQLMIVTLTEKSLQVINKDLVALIRDLKMVIRFGLEKIPVLLLVP